MTDESTVLNNLRTAHYGDWGLDLSSQEAHELWADIETKDKRVAELEAEIDEFLFASSNVLNPYDGISVPYEALKKLVKRVLKEREK